MATLSTHVLDTTTGRPAAGLAVRLRDASGVTLAEAVTDADGRVRPLGGELVAGDYALTFATGAYFAAGGGSAFHPRVTVEFTVTADPPAGGSAAGDAQHGSPDDAGSAPASQHYHVPLLLSPYGYTTYRGS